MLYIFFFHVYRIVRSIHHTLWFLLCSLSCFPFFHWRFIRFLSFASVVSQKKSISCSCLYAVCVFFHFQFIFIAVSHIRCLFRFSLHSNAIPVFHAFFVIVCLDTFIYEHCTNEALFNLTDKKIKFRSIFAENSRVNYSLTTKYNTEKASQDKRTSH